MIKLTLPKIRIARTKGYIITMAIGLVLGIGLIIGGVFFVHYWLWIVVGILVLFGCLLHTLAFMQE